MKKVVRPLKWMMLISGILIVIIGITMFFTPLDNLVLLALAIGISILISGISEIVSYFSRPKNGRSGWILVSGAVSILFGIWTIFGKGSVALAGILPIGFALWVMVSSIFRIAGAVSLNEGSPQWSWFLVFGILGVVLGIVLLFAPLLSGIIVSCIIAVMLITYGLNNLLMFFRLRAIEQYFGHYFDE